MPLAFSPSFASERSVTLYIEINVESHGFAQTVHKSQVTAAPHIWQRAHTPAVTKTVNHSHCKVYVKVYEGKHGYKRAEEPGRNEIHM